MYHTFLKSLEAVASLGDISFCVLVGSLLSWLLGLLGGKTLLVVVVPVPAIGFEPLHVAWQLHVEGTVFAIR